MEKLRKIINDKPYFIWTSNGDHHFALAGFKNLLEVEGNWQSGICSVHPGEHPIVDLKEILHNIYEKSCNDILTNKDLPTCQKCGAPLKLNIPGPKFQINQKQITQFEDFISKYQEKNILILELGIWPNNQMIKAPSMQLIADNKNSRYITINKGQVAIPKPIASRSIGFSSTILEAFDALINGKGDLNIQGPTSPELTSNEQEKQSKIIKKFYPSYTLNRSHQPGEMVMYTTIDESHPSHLHMVQHGRVIMYSFGDSVNVHCFTQNGRYQTVKLGLNKQKNEVHGFYVEAGTFIGMEIDPGVTGFSQLSITFPSTSDGTLMIPKVDQLVKLFPQQARLINVCHSTKLFIISILTFSTQNLT